MAAKTMDEIKAMRRVFVDEVVECLDTNAWTLRCAIGTWLDYFIRALEEDDRDAIKDSIDEMTLLCVDCVDSDDSDQKKSGEMMAGIIKRYTRFSNTFESMENYCIDGTAAFEPPTAWTVNVDVLLHYVLTNEGEIKPYFGDLFDELLAALVFGDKHLIKRPLRDMICDSIKGDKSSGFGVKAGRNEVFIRLMYLMNYINAS